MERGSDKHAPRLDDEMDRETKPMTQGSPIEARSDQARMKEPPADGEPMAEEVVRDDRR